MPIRESERHRYPPPKEWRAIRARIMERAKNRCECQGECGDDHLGATGETDAEHAALITRCLAPHGALIIRREGMPQFFDEHSPCGGCAGGDPDCARAVRVVLTIAHLNHTPEDNRDENLRAMCQRCHLKYDAAHHTKNARATIKARKAVGELPGLGGSERDGRGR